MVGMLLGMGMAEGGRAQERWQWRRETVGEVEEGLKGILRLKQLKYNRSYIFNNERGEVC